MPSVQTSYPESIGLATEGQIANPHTYDGDTYVAEEALNFGVAVQRGTADSQAKKGTVSASTSPFAVTDFIGVTVKDPTRDPGDDDTYIKGAHVTVMWRGDIWVKVEAAVSKGSKVTVKNSTGEFSATTAASAQGAIAGARWMSDAAADGLAILRLTGSEAIFPTS